MSHEFQLNEDFVLPLFDELFLVKERDFSLQYHPLGKGSQKLLMLVTSASEEFLPPSEMQLLQSIVERGLRMSMDDLWLVNLQQFPSQDSEALWEYFQPTRVMVWGCDAWLRQQGVKLDRHQYGYFKGAELLVAGELSSYLSDAGAKGKLWAAMQRMFFN